MAQPPAYARVFSFTDWTANNPQTPQPGARLDVEYDAIGTTLAAIRTNLALIQRDDGALANESVGPDALSPELTLGLRSVGAWVTDTDYIENDAVWTTGKLYRCATSHTAAGAFATDLAAERWTLIFDPTDMVQEAVNQAIADDLIEVNVDTSSFAGLTANNAFSGNNTFGGSSTFSQGPIVRVANATTAGDYLVLKPTDYGAAKPAFFIRKKATAGAWEIELDDGAAGSGSLDIVVSSFTALTVNGAAIAPASDITALNAAVRKARNLALTS